MKDRFVPLILAAAAAMTLCGCAGALDKEYVSVSDYVPAAPNSPLEDDDRISVASLSELRQALLSLVSAGETESIIIFDQAYSGDVTEDMASACWQARTQDALCAYCVENIAYDLSQIVTYYEAHVYISYSQAAQDTDSIVHLQYSTGIEDLLIDSISGGGDRLVILIDRSSYTAEGMELLASEVYREHPGIAPREPLVSVNLFSGSGMKRLYEINFNYGMSGQELDARMAQLDELEPFADIDTEDLDPAFRALTACEYLSGSCEYTDESAYDNIYSALIQHKAGSEGMALAYVELCGMLELDCRIVYGQRDWQSYCWNIVKIGDEYYHVDPAVCATEGMAQGFLLADEKMWGSYRWDTASYPACSGSLSYSKLIEPVAAEDLDAGTGDDVEAAAPQTPEAEDSEETVPPQQTPDAESGEDEKPPDPGGDGGDAEGTDTDFS